jgi:hypothetical protein
MLKSVAKTSPSSPLQMATPHVAQEATHSPAIANVPNHPLLDPDTQKALATRLSNTWDSPAKKPCTEELRQLDRALSEPANARPILDAALERALIRGLQWAPVSGPCETILARVTLSGEGLSLFADSLARQFPAARELAFDLARNPLPQSDLFVGPGAAVIFNALTPFFYSPHGHNVEMWLPRYRRFFDARINYLTGLKASEHNDESLTALAQTAFFLGRCLRRTVRCRAAEAEGLLRTHKLVEPLLEGVLRGATGRLGLLLRTISKPLSATERITLLIRKLPPEQLLPTVKQALAAHLLRDRAQI